MLTKSLSDKLKSILFALDNKTTFPSEIEIVIDLPYDILTKKKTTVIINNPLVIEALSSRSISKLNETLQYHSSNQFNFDYNDFSDKPVKLNTKELTAIIEHYSKLRIVTSEKTGLNLSYFDLNNVIVPRASNLSSALFIHTFMNNFSSIKCIYDNADFNSAHICHSKILSSSAINTHFENAILTGSNLSGTNFTNSFFNKAILSETKMSTNCKFIEADLRDADLSYCSCEGTNFSNAKMTGVKATNSIKDSIDLNPIYCDYFYFYGARMPEEDTFSLDKTNDLIFDTEYELIEEINSGEYATTYKALNNLSQSTHTIRVYKIPKKNRITVDDEISQLRNHHKKLNLIALENKNIVLYNWSRMLNKNIIITAMEYINGKNLGQTDILQLSVQTRENYIHQLLVALSSCHAKKETHNDLHEGNIMITQDGTIKIIDFAIEHFLTLNNFHKDVYSLGLITYLLLTGKPLNEPTSYDSFNLLCKYDLNTYEKTLSTNLMEESHIKFILKCLAAGLGGEYINTIDHYNTATEALTDWSLITSTKNRI